MSAAFYGVKPCGCLVFVASDILGRAFTRDIGESLMAVLRSGGTAGYTQSYHGDGLMERQWDCTICAQPTQQTIGLLPSEVSS